MPDAQREFDPGGLDRFVLSRVKGPDAMRTPGEVVRAGLRTLEAPRSGSTRQSLTAVVHCY